MTIVLYRHLLIQVQWIRINAQNEGAIAAIAASGIEDRNLQRIVNDGALEQLFTARAKCNRTAGVNSNRPRRHY